MFETVKEFEVVKVEREEVKKRTAFGNLILESRKNKSYSLQKLSDVMGGEITPSYINRLEKSEKDKPSFDVVCQLVQALDLDLAEVFEAFGYQELYISTNSRLTELQELTGDEFTLQIRLDSSLGLSTHKKKMIEKLVNETIDYSQSGQDDSFGFIPKIIQTVEDFRKKTILN